jgi:2-dehydropantoate 2-reductase
MKVAVIGAGAVGGYFGARLAEYGNEVAFITRGRTLAALRSRGLRLESPKGDLSLRPEIVSENPAEVGMVDLVLLGVKAWQVTDVAPSLPPLIGGRTCVVPLQNGVEAAAQLAAVLGPEPVLGGLCKIISMQVAPGYIRHQGVEPFVALGEVDRPPTPRVRRLATAFAEAGVSVQTPDDIQVAIWEKFLLICSVSGVGAVTGEPIGVSRVDPEARAMLIGVMREVVAVAAGQGVELPADAVEQTLHFVDSLPPDGTASMQRDILEGRPSELESQNGAVVRLGREAGVPTPVNLAIYRRLLPLEERSRAAPPEPGRG